VSGGSLTAPTVRYLFASSWAPASSGWAVRLPGGSFDGPGTAGNLLNLAIWSLVEQRVLATEQARPVQKESVVMLGGKSFSRFTLIDPTARRAGLEGAIVAAAQRASKMPLDAEGGLRGLIIALRLHDRAPWTTVAGHCFAEAAHAGLVAAKGKLFKKPVFTDPAAVDAYRERDAEIVAARTAYREAHGDLDTAVISDCFAALNWAHSTG